ncbi:general secretion pathway protein GspF [Sediminicola sp. YIK13]|uniref:type II secretion system F family protein n=1 Tax=Sediminicola sp. YIK13 TaxID=1453352 RepID=UPI00071FEE0B|nr:type II secretion system F family protein [Sediminicola sp. YIK13]ALM08812.1 general secretion pathway protein GspF [Sediminicola sp. YIK13]
MGFKLEHTTIGAKKEFSKGMDNTSILQKEINFFGSTFSNKKKEDFYTELSVLLKAGITLKDGLNLIAENQTKEKQRQFYLEMVDGLVAGTSFSEVIHKKEEFTEYEYYSLKIGEETGTVYKITEELGKFFARKNEHRRNLINALTYPIIILVTAVLVVVFMLRLVVPMFQDIFKQNNVELPGITKFIIGASDFIRDYGWWVLIFLLGLLFFRKLFTKKESFKRKRDYLVLRIPYAGNFVKAVYLAQFTQAVTLLTSSKVPLLNSIELVGRMIDFYPLKDALSTVEEKIMKGSGLSESLKGNKIFDNRMISLVKVAEETNQTEFIFERLNQQYNIEVQQKSKLLSTLMEPLIIVFVGILVGLILVAMYLPMFKLGSVLG